MSFAFDEVCDFEVSLFLELCQADPSKSYQGIILEHFKEMFHTKGCNF